MLMLFGNINKVIKKRVEELPQPFYNRYFTIVNSLHKNFPFYILLYLLLRMLTEKKIKVNKHLLFNEITYIYTVNNQQKGIKNGKRTSL